MTIIIKIIMSRDMITSCCLGKIYTRFNRPFGNPHNYIDCNISMENLLSLHQKFCFVGLINENPVL